MRYPVKKVFITQKHGVNEDVYSRFGYKGHNGVDLRLYDTSGNRSDTSLVYAPHDGIIRERRSDPDGYGNYLKLESSTEGSILGHLKEFKVNINKHVKEGDLIGIADNTGWSTGAHLHWGYYRNPRDRSNGYGGTIDPTPYIVTDTDGVKTYTEEEMTEVREARDHWWDGSKKLLNVLDIFGLTEEEYDEMIDQGIEEIEKTYDEISEAGDELIAQEKSSERKIKKLNKQVEDLITSNNLVQQDLYDLISQLEEAGHSTRRDKHRLLIDFKQNENLLNKLWNIFINN